MGILALDAKSASAVFPVGYTDPSSADVRGLGLLREGDVLLQGVQLLVSLSLERVAEHTVVRARLQRGGR